MIWSTKLQLVLKVNTKSNKFSQICLKSIRKCTKFHHTKYKMNFKSKQIHLEFSTIQKVQFFVQFSDCIIYCYKLFFFIPSHLCYCCCSCPWNVQTNKEMNVKKKRKTWKMLMYMACPVRANFLVMNSYQMENNIHIPTPDLLFMQNWIGGNVSRHWKHLYLHNNC